MRPGDRKPDCGNKLVPAAGAERLHRELLQWLPGETLFSLVSRLHRLWVQMQVQPNGDAIRRHGAAAVLPVFCRSTSLAALRPDRYAPWTV